MVRLRTSQVCYSGGQITPNPGQSHVPCPIRLVTQETIDLGQGVGQRTGHGGLDLDDRSGHARMVVLADQPAQGSPRR